MIRDRITVGRTAAAVLALTIGGIGLSACASETAEDPAPEASSSAAAQATSAPAASAGPDGASLEEISPARGLSLSLPAGSTSEEPRALDNGIRQVKYFSNDPVAPLQVIVEYVPDGSLSAASLVETETRAFASDGVTVTTSPTQVPGGSGAQLMTWKAESPAPWTAGATTTLDCGAVFVDGHSGYVYSVYVCAEAAAPDSVELKDQVVNSLTVSEP